MRKLRISLLSLILTFVLLMNINTTIPGNIEINQAPSEITLGGLFPLTGILSGGGVEREAVFRLAIEEINANPNLLPDTQIIPIIRDTATDPITGGVVATELVELGVAGVVGAASSLVSKSVADVLTPNKIPQISYSSTNPDLSDKAIYPYFMRVVAPDPLQGKAMANYLLYRGVNEVAILTINDLYSSGISNKFQEIYTPFGGVVMELVFTSGTDPITQLTTIKDAGVTDIILLGYTDDAKSVFRTAVDLGMVSSDGFNWFVPNSISYDGLLIDQYGIVDFQIRDAAQNIVGFRHHLGSGAIYEHLLDIWEAADPTIYAGAGDRDPNTFAVFTYDAVYTFANAFHNMIVNGENVFDGDLLLSNLASSQFEGATGSISFDVNYDRNGKYDIVQLIGENFVSISTWDNVQGVISTITKPESITLGGLFPLTGALSFFGVEMESAFRLAVDQINKDPSILPNTVLQYDVRDTQTNPTGATAAATELVSTGVFSIVGPAGSSMAIAASQSTTAAKVPLISYSATSPDLSDKTQYPYFMRTVAPDTFQGSAMAEALIGVGINQISIISGDNPYNRDINNAFASAFTQLGGTINGEYYFNEGTTDSIIPILNEINDLRSREILLNTFINDGVNILNQAIDMSMSAQDGYQWLGFDAIANERLFTDNEIINERILDAVNGMIGTRMGIPWSNQYEAFLDLWESSDPSIYSGAGDRDHNLFIPFVYDAVYTTARAAHSLIEVGDDPFNGDLMIIQMSQDSFDGVSGPVSFDKNYDRNSYFEITNLKFKNFVQVGSWSQVEGFFLFEPIQFAPGYNPGQVTTTTDDHVGDILNFPECSNPTASVTLTYTDQLGYNINQINFGKDQCVEIKIQNLGYIDHDFILEDVITGETMIFTTLFPSSGFSVDQQPLIEKILRFITPDKDITFIYYDSVPGHREIGEEGFLVIGEGTTTTSDTVDQSTTEEEIDSSFAPEILGSNFLILQVLFSLISINIFKGYRKRK